MDLLQSSSAAALSGCRAVHSRDLRLAASATLHRLGLRLSRAFMKCSSTAETERDWIRAARVLVSDGAEWQVALELRDLPRPAPEAVQWFDLGGRAGGTARGRAG